MTKLVLLRPEGASAQSRRSDRRTSQFWTRRRARLLLPVLAVCGLITVHVYGAVRAHGSAAQAVSHYAARIGGSAATARLLAYMPLPNCSVARSLGATAAKRGEPGYRVHLDRDNDGISCEPFAAGGRLVQRMPR